MVILLPVRRGLIETALRLRLHPLDLLVSLRLPILPSYGVDFVLSYECLRLHSRNVSCMHGPVVNLLRCASSVPRR